MLLKNITLPIVCAVLNVQYPIVIKILLNLNSLGTENIQNHKSLLNIKWREIN